MKTLSSGVLIGFADVLAILYKDKSWTDIKSETEKNLKKYVTGNLTINSEKTPFTSYSNHLPDLEPLNIDEETDIDEKGNNISRHLSWDLHTKNLTK